MMKGSQWVTRKWILILGAFSLISFLTVIILWLIVLPRALPADAVVVPRDFSTIQSAIDHASPGAIIVVLAKQGEFLGPITIATPDISVVSRGGRAKLHCENTGPGIIIHADGVSVAGFDVEGAKSGVKLENVSHSVIKDVVVEGAQLGVALVDSYSNTLSDLSVSACEIGIQMTSSDGNNLKKIRMEALTSKGISLVGSRTNSIDEVSIAGAQIGISLEQGSDSNKILSCQVTECVASGVEVIDSSSNILTENVIKRSGIGISLTSVTDTTLGNNQISACSAGGITLHKSQQDLLFGNKITTSDESGIALLDSNESTLRDNNIEDCGGPGIDLDNARKNLVFANQLTGNNVGMQGQLAESNRFVQNVIRGSALAGVMLTEGGQNLLVGNQISESGFGIALTGTDENSLLRNAIMDCSADCLSLINQSKHNLIEQNSLESGSTGILLASSSQNRILDNAISKNEEGVKLFLSGFGTVIETNSISDNQCGINIADSLGKEETILRGSEIELIQEGDNVSSLTIANNILFGNRRYDISNQTEDTVLAGGNRWGECGLLSGSDAALVSSGVIVQQTSPRGSIAVGTVDTLEQVILGRLLQLYLQDRGFKVVDLIGLGGEERLKTALLEEDVDIAWLGFPRSDIGEFPPQKFTIFPAISAQNRTAVIASSEIADRLPSANISELSQLMKEGGSKIVIAVPETISKEELALFASTYDLPITDEDVIWTKDLDETEVLLKLNTAQVGVVKAIEETLPAASFSMLADDKNFFDTSQSALILRQDFLLRYPELSDIESQLAPLLTTEVMQALATRVRLLKRDPTQVVRDYLQEEGLITW